MAGRIVLFGATGYTGRLTAEALLQRGVRPVLASTARSSPVATRSRCLGSVSCDAAGLTMTSGDAVPMPMP